MANDEFERFKALQESDPEGFRNLVLSLNAKLVKPHAAQQTVLESDARFKVLNCGRRWGKCHDLNTPILTPTGWARIGDIKVGALVVGSDGQPTAVTGVFPQGVKPLVEVHLKGGAIVKSGYEHLWTVRRRWRKGRANLPETLTAQEIMDEGVLMKRNDGRVERTFAIQPVEPVHHPEKILPIRPYTLGALLGDGALKRGTPTLSSVDPEIPAAISAEGYDVRALTVRADKCPMFSVCGIIDIVRALKINVRSEFKHVPAEYLTASIAQRLEVLRGLMDTDGWLEANGRKPDKVWRACCFASSSEQLTKDVQQLALSLGGKASKIHAKKTTHLDSYTLTFYMPDGMCPFKLSRKADRWAPTPPERLARQITAITPVQAEEAVCISVAADDCLYVVNDYVLTHNTIIAAKMIISKTRKKNQMVWWCAPSYKIVKRGYAEVLKQLPEGVLSHPPQPDSNFDAGRSVVLKFKNGSRMEFYSAERPEGMLGAGVDYVVMDEAATMNQRIWNQIISPTLMDRCGGALMISTPRGQNWFWKVYQMGQDPLLDDWDSWTFPSSSNPTLPEGEVERMRRAMPRLEFEQEVLAKFISAGSSVFHIPDNIIEDLVMLENGLLATPEGKIVKPTGYVMLGIDLARTNDFTVIYGCRTNDRRNCYFERMQAVTWPEQKRRIRRAVATLLRSGAEHVMLMIDSTGLGDPVYEDLEAEGYDAVGINFTTHKTNMVRLLAKDLEESQAFLIEGGQIEEFRAYTMTMSAAGRMMYSAPEGEHDDVVAAKMLAHWGCINEGFGDIQTITPDDREAAPYDGSDVSAYEGDFSDLIEPDVMEEIGLAPDNRRPTELELMNSPDLWF